MDRSQDKRNGITAIRETQSLLLDRSDPTPERIALEWPETKPPLFPPEAKRLLKLQELYEAEITLKPSEFKAAYVDDLPTAWTVCSISIDEERDDIMFSRLRNGKEPVIVRLPLRRQASRDNGSEDCLGYKAALAEFQDILAGNDATLEQSASNMSRADRVQWWNTRKALDERLGSLLAGIDTTWLGAFKVSLAEKVTFRSRGSESMSRHSLCCSPNLQSQPRDSKRSGIGSRRL